LNDTSSPPNAYPAFAAAKVDCPMKAFNAEYRRWRLATREAGESGLSSKLGWSDKLAWFDSAFKG